MKIDNELKNFWNDERKVKKVEKALSKDENISKKKFNENKENEPIIKIEKLESKNSNISTVMILGLLFVCAVFITYILITIIKEKDLMNQNNLKQIEKANNNQYYQNDQEIRKEEQLIYKRNHLKLDNNIYSNNLYNIQNSIYNYYQDKEFLKNLEPFFNNLTVIKLPRNDKIYEFEIKGILSRYGNFSYIIYKRTNIIEFDNEVIKELERFKKIKFREQQKDIDFSLTITNKYKLIN